MRAAIRRRHTLIAQRVLALQIPRCNAAGDHAPRQNFILAAAAVGVKVRVKTALLKGLHPAVQIKIVLPRAERLTLAPRGLDDLAEPAVAAGDDCLHKARGRGVPVVRDGLGVHRLAQELDAALVLFNGDLRLPLEGRVGLGHEPRGRHRDAHAARLVECAFAPGVHDMGRDVGNAEHVLVRLGRKAEHEVELDRAVSARKRAAAGFEQLEKSVQRYSAQQHTGNPVLDVILTTKERTCADRGITFTAVADGSLLDGMSSMDIASLFGNALDNAIEATLKLPNPEQRLIKLALFEQNHFIVIRVENYYDSRLSKDADGNLRTTKRDDQHRHGFGVKSIRHIAQQYGGEVTIRTNDHWFVLTVLLPRQTGLMAM